MACASAPCLAAASSCGSVLSAGSHEARSTRFESRTPSSQGKSCELTMSALRVGRARCEGSNQLSACISRQFSRCRRDRARQGRAPGGLCKTKVENVLCGHGRVDGRAHASGERGQTRALLVNMSYIAQNALCRLRMSLNTDTAEHRGCLRLLVLRKMTNRIAHLQCPSIASSHGVPGSEQVAQRPNELLTLAVLRMTHSWTCRQCGGVLATVTRVRRRSERPSACLPRPARGHHFLRLSVATGRSTRTAR